MWEKENKELNNDEPEETSKAGDIHTTPSAVEALCQCQHRAGKPRQSMTRLVNWEDTE